jgi:hypothetical protein
VSAAAAAARPACASYLAMHSMQRIVPGSRFRFLFCDSLNFFVGELHDSCCRSAI